MSIDGVTYRVAVREHPEHTIYVLHNRTQVEGREQRFALVLVAGTPLVSLLPAAGGRWLAVD